MNPKAIFAALIEKIREAADSMLSHGNIRDQLQAAISEIHQGSYCWVMDVYGDAESGDVVYSHQGEYFKRSYELTTQGGKRATLLGDPMPVLPRLQYDLAMGDADFYTAMESRMRCEERHIPKADRDAAKVSDFAGKNRSFPILTQEDVEAAVRAMPKAGAENYNVGTLKKNIVKIATAKGWGSKLPKTWAASAVESEEAVVLGDAIALREGAIKESAVSADGQVKLKLIAPGRGSSGFYPAAVLERDGPKVFKKGTKNYWNHQTDAEEASRPEGDLRDLASVLTEDAYWDENGKKGPGLYAMAQVFEHYRGPVNELAPHIGTSIRAEGKKNSEAMAPDGKKGVIESLTRGISVDYVTMPGAGGEILQLFEAARTVSIPTDVKESKDEMTPEEIKKLVETETQTRLAPVLTENAALQAKVKKLNESSLMSLAASKVRMAVSLPAVKLHEATKNRLVSELSLQAPQTAEGALDEATFAPMIEKAIKAAVEETASITGARGVQGMGASVQESADLTEAQYDAQIRESLAARGITDKKAQDEYLSGAAN